MQFIDSHCHLNFSQFVSCREELIFEAAQQGVTDIVVPGVVASDWHVIQQLSSSYLSIHTALGLHPCFLNKHLESDLDLLEASLSSGGVCAVGEIGLDLFIADADIEKQLFFFQAQLDLACQFSLPVLLHVRKAHDQVLKQLRQYKLSSGGIVHAFSGSEQQAKQYLALGFKLGLGGTVTYERAKKLRHIVTELPLDSFVLETDAPDMPLSGYQGEPNRPARVREVAQEVAELKGCSLQEVASATSLQASKLLDL